MTNFESVWANSANSWKPIDCHRTYTFNVLIVFAWVGMIAFFVSLLFLLLARTDAATYFMLASLCVWLGCGVASKRKAGSSRWMAFGAFHKHETQGG